MPSEIAELSYRARSIEGAPQKRALVYLPDGYGAGEYPLLVLLHGIGGDEREWLYPDVAGPSRCKEILDDAAREGHPVVALFPNGRTCPQFADRTASAVSGSFIGDLPNVRGFYRFREELRGDLLPAAERAFSLTRRRELRALAGLSMGGMQAVNFGVRSLDLFGWIGGFSCAPTTVCGALAGVAVRGSGYSLEGFYTVCGDRDLISYPTFRMLTEGFEACAGDRVKRFRAETLAGLGHDFTVWNHGLEGLLHMMFRPDGL